MTRHESRRTFMIQASAAALGLMTTSGRAAGEGTGLKKLLKPPKLNTDLPIEEIAGMLQGRIPALLTQHRVAGLSMAIIRQGQVAWRGSFGVKSANTKEPVDDETVFEAASLTKPLFATAVMKLVETGELDLDRPLDEYLDEPYIPETDQHERLRYLTARHVLSQTSGFPNWRRGEKLKFLVPPGKRWLYSGEGFVYLQHVAEHVTGKPIEEFVREKVLDPLDLKLTEAKWVDRHEENFADAHSTEGESSGRRKGPEGSAAGTVQTTGGEYAQFMTMFMDPRRSEPRVLKRSTMEEMLTPQVEIKERAVRGKIFWGLGWGLQHSADGNAFWHWGNNPGFKCFCIGYPEHGIGTAIFTNADFGWKVYRKATPIALGGEQTALMWKS